MKTFNVAAFVISTLVFLANSTPSAVASEGGGCKGFRVYHKLVFEPQVVFLALGDPTKVIQVCQGGGGTLYDRHLCLCAEIPNQPFRDCVYVLCQTSSSNFYDRVYSDPGCRFADPSTGDPVEPPVVPAITEQWCGRDPVDPCM